MRVVPFVLLMIVACAPRFPVVTPPTQQCSCAAPHAGPCSVWEWSCGESQCCADRTGAASAPETVETAQGLVDAIGANGERIPSPPPPPPPAWTP